MFKHTTLDSIAYEKYFWYFFDIQINFYSGKQ